MGVLKREMDENDAKRAVAISICLEAGTLDQCDDHEELSDATGSGDTTAARELATKKWEDGALKVLKAFDSLDELLQWIEQVSGDNVSDACPSCQRADEQ
ncbi:MAG: hypothetical protein ACRDF4_01230 [Rhabdochlamydiaceae bacterium]